MKTAIYPGSFNPWHKGHQDVLEKALKIFDEIIVARGKNPGKELFDPEYPRALINNPNVRLTTFEGLLADYVNLYNENVQSPIAAVIRGLRNGHDLQYEMNQQYYNEDLGLRIPTVFFITDQSVSHISSSAIRQIRSFGKNI